MKVLLKANVPGLGVEGEIKQVKPGYYYNYLLAKELAVIASKEIIAKTKKEKAKLKEEKEKETVAYEKIAKALEGKKIKVSKTVAKDKKLYSQVKPTEVVKAILKAAKNSTDLLQPEMVKIEEPIQELGEYPIEVALKGGIKAKITLAVVVQK